MPVYHKLRLTSSHTPAAQARNRRIASNLLRLRNKLREHFQADQSRRDGVQEDRIKDSTRLLRLATWNIREFDSNNYGKRLEESLYYIAEIIAQFDLVALQEVREGREALDAVMELLGPGWRYIATDVTEGAKGNRERMVFVYNAHKVFFADVAGEVVLPKDKVDDTLLFKKGARLELPEEGQELLLRENIPTYHRRGIEKLNQEVRIKLPEQTKLVLPSGSALILPKRTAVSRTAEEQPAFPLDNDLKDVIIKLPRRAAISESLNYARTPYLVTFQAGWLKLTLCTVHIYYGKNELGMRRRKAEIRRLTEFLADRAQDEHDSDADSFFIVLGDFNIVDHEHETMKALVRNGFEVPEQLQSLPGTNVKQDKYYDQIAYWRDPNHSNRPTDSVTQVEVQRAGVFDFFETLFRHGEPAGSAPADIDIYQARSNSLRQAVAKAKTSKQKRKKAPLTAEEEQAVAEKVYLDWRTYQMSDHLPMWVELRIDFGDEYLESVANDE
jgi:endonuclease/exonuclease/phosphatase family metal-dependent hydrolase